MKIGIFDIETYKELFVFGFIKFNVSDDAPPTELKRMCLTASGRIDSNLLKSVDSEFDSCDYIVSFNGSMFDLPILAKMSKDIERLGSTTSRYVWNDANQIINSNKFKTPMMKPSNFKRSWSCKHFDLLRNCLTDKSLKQWEMYNGLRIRELPYDPASELTEHQKLEIADYCMYDVFATSTLFFKYGYSDNAIGSSGYPTLLVYKEMNELWPKSLVKKFDRTPQALSAGIVYGCQGPITPKTLNPLDFIKFETFGCPTEIKEIIVALSKGADSNVDTSFKGIQIGKGGAHFVKKGLHRDVYGFDVAGQYPRIISRWKLLKTSQAVEKFTELKDWRNSLKKLKGTPEYHHNSDAGLKKILNSLSGAFRMKSAYSTAYDPAAGDAMCYIAQMLIAELAFAVDNLDDLIEVNTDSVFVVGDSAVKKLREKTAEMSSKYDMEFEEDFMPIVYFRDVNNYIVYNSDGSIKFGKGLDYKDMLIKKSEPAVTSELFKNLILKDANVNFDNYDWKDFIFKYHRSGACKYAAIGEVPMGFKNYYMLWTTKNCPNSNSICFTRTLIDKKNGSIKTRHGVCSQDIKELHKYAGYIDRNQYRIDLDDLFELWNKPEFCTTRVNKIASKSVKSLGDALKLIYGE